MSKTWREIRYSDMYKPLWGFVPINNTFSNNNIKQSLIKGEIIKNPKKGATYVFVPYKPESNKRRKGGKIYDINMIFSNTEEEAKEEYNKHIDILINELEENIIMLEEKEKSLKKLYKRMYIKQKGE